MIHLLLSALIAGMPQPVMEAVSGIDSMVADMDDGLNTRNFLVTGSCIPGIGYETCELTLREDVWTELEDDFMVVREIPRYLCCRFRHAGFTASSEYYLDETGELALCISSWDTGGEDTLFRDVFYFSQGTVIACKLEDEDLHGASPGEREMGAARLAHLQELLDTVTVLTIAAPPTYQERFRSAYELD